VKRVPVKRVPWVTVLLLLVSAVCVSVVPRADSPETTFNETDAPVNLAPPARPGVVVAPPAINPVVAVPWLSCPTCSMNRVELESAVTPHQRHRPSLQSLFCTLLI
jgi:hypothetical protein